MSLMFVPEDPTDNNTALFLDYGLAPLSEPMLTRFTEAYMRHYREMS